MITLSALTSLENNSGLTLKNGQPVSYKTGFQVATSGIETTDAGAALQAVRNYGGNCGIWYSDGIYYVDESRRVKTKRDALKIGRAHNQISVLSWQNMQLIYC